MPTILIEDHTSGRDKRTLTEAKFFLVLLYGRSEPLIVSRRVLEEGRQYKPGNLLAIYPIPAGSLPLPHHLPRVFRRRRANYTIELMREGAAAPAAAPTEYPEMEMEEDV